MQRDRVHTQKQKAAALLMLTALLWLTVSIPFVYKCQQAYAKEKSSQSSQQNDSSGNPLAGTSEEKNLNSSGSPIAEEFLHHHEELISFFSASPGCLHPADEATYTAFHGELLCPPPNI